MSKSSEERDRANARRAYNMKRDGATSREIARAIGCKPAQVRARVLLGERLVKGDVK